MLRSLACLALSLAVLPLAAAAQRPPKIGIITTLTGPAATYGIDIKNGLVFANEQLAAGSYELVIEDDKCNGRDAISAAHRLVDVEKVRYVLGFGCSGAVLSAAPVLENGKVLTIATGTSTPAISEAGDYIFRTWPSDSAAASILLQALAAKFHKVGILSEETEYALGFARALEQETAKQSPKLDLVKETYLPGSTDFRTQLLKLKTAKLEAVIINPQTESSAAAIVKQIHEMKWEIARYGAINLASSAFSEHAGSLADGVVVPDVPMADEVETARGAQLLAEFRKRYSVQSWDYMVVSSMAAFFALDQAIRAGGDPKEFLYTHLFSDILKGISFDRNGDIRGIRHVLKRWEHGRLVQIP